MGKGRILIVDDEVHILELLRYNLESNGYQVVEADTGESALAILEHTHVELVLLDLMLPGIDGLEVLRKIRQSEELTHLPVIMLTAKNKEFDTVIGLELGADDYIGKPFGVHELLARIKAVRRRAKEVAAPKESGQDDTLEIDDLTINKSTHEVIIRGEHLELPLKEFELLTLLASNRGRVFDREYLLEKIWGYDYYGETRTVDVHIRSLRKKLELDDKNPKHIKTVRGVGYKYK
ncbi:response regulator transcription factor [Vallitalea pronyensis]|uniref:Stage 0 sporulation protein A homolog n=1 Tax=Vallitalea pronyensis TaxID=1348613 RepID=A0A8J8SGU3_9FIRM|nr:response regulator transcription factor [Vallitalea pronyensis]QUI22722.1 response regulator transcription factor [Vallitalea pronyensis]